MIQMACERNWRRCVRRAVSDGLRIGGRGANGLSLSERYWSSVMGRTAWLSVGWTGWVAHFGT